MSGRGEYRRKFFTLQRNKLAGMKIRCHSGVIWRYRRFKEERSFPLDLQVEEAAIRSTKMASVLQWQNGLGPRNEPRDVCL